MTRVLAVLGSLVATPTFAQVSYPLPDTSGFATTAQVQQAQTTANNASTKADSVATEMLTSANRQQALRVQVTPDANGRVTFTYPVAYVAGTKPAVTTTAETPNGAAYRNDASVEENTATNTQVVILVQRVPKTIVVSILGSVTTLISPVTTPVWINVLVRAPL